MGDSSPNYKDRQKTVFVCVGLMVRWIEFELPRSRRSELSKPPEQTILADTPPQTSKLVVHIELSGPLDSYISTSNIDSK